MTDIARDPWMSANVIFDILNEPDSYGLTWGPNGSQLQGKGLGYWYHKVMSTGYAINPSASQRLLGPTLHSSICASWRRSHALNE